MVDGKPVKSPDHPARRDAGQPDREAAGLQPRPLRRLRGHGAVEGRQQSSTACSKARSTRRTARMEMADGHPALRIIEFDVAKQEWTGRSWLYPLRRGRRVDRRLQHDRRHDRARHRARPGRRHAPTRPAPTRRSRSPTALPTPAKLKRIYKIELTDANAGKRGAQDRLHRPDEDRRPGQQEAAGRRRRLLRHAVQHDRERRRGRRDAHHRGDDNNLPFSAGRALDKADDNEFVLLEVGEFLAAK